MKAIKYLQFKNYDSVDAYTTRHIGYKEDKVSRLFDYNYLRSELLNLIKDKKIAFLKDDIKHSDELPQEWKKAVLEHPELLNTEDADIVFHLVRDKNTTLFRESVTLELVKATEGLVEIINKCYPDSNNLSVFPGDYISVTSLNLMCWYGPFEMYQNDIANILKKYPDDKLLHYLFEDDGEIMQWHDVNADTVDVVINKNLKQEIDKSSDKDIFIALQNVYPILVQHCISDKTVIHYSEYAKFSDMLRSKSNSKLAINILHERSFLLNAPFMTGHIDNIFPGNSKRITALVCMKECLNDSLTFEERRLAHSYFSKYRFVKEIEELKRTYNY